MFRHRFLVYGLVDPRSKMIRYVGASTQGLKRPRQHWEPYYLQLEGHTHKAHWIQQLLALNLVPEIFVLQTLASADEVWDAESAWIAQLRSMGAKLTNSADGGRGAFGCVRSEETKRKMGAPKIGKPRSPEARAKMSASHKARVRSPEEMDRARHLGDAWKGKTRSPETRAKMSAAKKGKPRSAETIEKISASHKARGMTPEQLEHMSRVGASNKGKPKSEETKERMAEGQRRRWAERKAQAAETAE